MRPRADGLVYVRRLPVLDDEKRFAEDVMVEVAPHVSVCLDWLDVTRAERALIVSQAMAEKETP